MKFKLLVLIFLAIVLSACVAQPLEEPTENVIDQDVQRSEVAEQVSRERFCMLVYNRAPGGLMPVLFCRGVRYNNRFIITAGHCCSTDNTKLHHRAFIAGEYLSVFPKWNSSSHDAAILEMRIPNNIQPEQVGINTTTYIGMPCMMFDGKHYRYGKVIKANQRIYIYDNAIETTIQAEPGISGSGVYDLYGKLIGIISHRQATYLPGQQPTSIVQPISEITKGFEVIKMLR